MKARPKSSLEREVLSFLEHRGFVWADEIEGRPSPVVAALKSHVKSGFPRLWQAWGRYESGRLTPRSFYRRVPDARAMAIIMSVSPEITVASFAKAARVLKTNRRLSAGAKILDVSTGAGFLPTWLATRHPNVTFVGTDASESLIRAAKSGSRGIRNVSFRDWDHFDPAPRGLGVFDTIVATYAVPLMEQRESHRFEFVRDQLARAFTAWQAVAHSETKLVLISRLPFPTDLDAAITAATASGWKLDVSASTDVVGGGECIPLLVFSSHLKR